MSKLQPPIIEGILPAFYGNLLTVPFQMNRAVSRSEVKGFSLKIKTVQNSRLIYSSGAQSLADQDDDLVVDWDDLNVIFAIDQIKEENRLRVGQHYKIQIAYVDATGQTGHYSSVAVVKYTTEPNVYIENMSADKNNLHLHTYTGVYSQENGDTTEKMYSYKFNLYDKNHKLIYTTGEQIHNSSENVNPAISIGRADIGQDLNQDDKFYLQFEVTTGNKMVYTSPAYIVVQKIPINPEFNFEISAAIPDREDGGIAVYLHRIPGKIAVGSFKLLRADSKTDFQEWNELLDFKFYNEDPERELFVDYTVEQGVSYKYATIQYSKFNLWSNRMETEAVRADFEHAYLYDGKRQLKIKYNPKVSSFKNVHLEAKVDTIGSKHPFIFRNGVVDYKEFPIAGLISYLSDENGLFMVPEELGLDSISAVKRSDDISGKQFKTTNLVDYNMFAERNFKMEVLRWLNNGQPKIFRSPSEGNYIIRLLNCSLSPEDRLGRMLHSFTSTAYEIADYNFKSLSSLGFIGNVIEARKVLGWETVDVSEALADGKDNLLNYKAQSLLLEDLVPGERVFINDGVKRQDKVTGKPSLGQWITIGATGNYKLDLGDEIPISEVKVELTENRPVRSLITYAYYKTSSNNFDLIRSMEIIDEPIRQLHGPMTEDEFKAEYNDIKSSLQKIYFLRAFYDNSTEDNNPDAAMLYING